MGYGYDTAELLEEIKTLKASTGWRSIATAPLNEGPSGFLVLWSKRSWPRFARRAFGGWYDTAGHQVYDPTHWMPLPAAPGETT